jgi:hypothetical protein
MTRRSPCTLDAATRPRPSPWPTFPTASLLTHRDDDRAGKQGLIAREAGGDSDY